MYANCQERDAFRGKNSLCLTCLNEFDLLQVIVVDNYFTGSKDNLKKWIGHPRFEFIRHGINLSKISHCLFNHVVIMDL